MKIEEVKETWKKHQRQCPAVNLGVPAGQFEDVCYLRHQHCILRMLGIYKKCCFDNCPFMYWYRALETIKKKHEHQIESFKGG